VKRELTRLARKINKALALLIVAGLPLSGCAGPAKATDIAGSDGNAARKLYVSKCAKCHKFYDPAKYSEADWQMWMSKMSKKAKLNSTQEQMLSHYLEETYRGSRLTNNPAQKF
jgi:hypothetical protein